jgi:hypothetical protein
MAWVRNVWPTLGLASVRWRYPGDASICARRSCDAAANDTHAWARERGGCRGRGECGPWRCLGAAPHFSPHFTARHAAGVAVLSNSQAAPPTPGHAQTPPETDLHQLRAGVLVGQQHVRRDALDARRRAQHAQALGPQRRQAVPAGRRGGAARRRNRGSGARRKRARQSAPSVRSG